MLGHTFLHSWSFVGLERSSALWHNLKEGRNNFCASWHQEKLLEETEVGGWCSCALWSHQWWSILVSAQDCGWQPWTYLPRDKHDVGFYVTLDVFKAMNWLGIEPRTSVILVWCSNHWATSFLLGYQAICMKVVHQGSGFALYIPTHEPDWCITSRSGAINVYRYFLVFSKPFKASCCWGHDEADQEMLEGSWLAYVCPCTHTQPFQRHFMVWRESGHQPIYTKYCFIGGKFYVISTQ